MENYNYYLAERFSRDFRIPIIIVSDPELFEYELNFYEKDFCSMTKWKTVTEKINENYNGNIETFKKELADLRDSVIEIVQNNEVYKSFCSDDETFKKLKNIRIPRTIYGSKSTYNQLAVGKNYISIDMKQANFQTLHRIGVFEQDTWEEFIHHINSEFAGEYLAESKYLRQAVLGKLNPGRIIAKERELMSNIYFDYIYSDYSTQVMYFGSDEIIIEDTLTDEEYKKLTDDLSKSGLMLKVQKFKLDGFISYVIHSDMSEHKIGEFYKRSCDGP